ncbi:hypothetical protein [Actinomadura flavalba]|uniref:hypothetical protein n=1 Tax=Actinomadura flavalba TaxID=1120938 RepID=UPI00036D9CC1|nr:hypothetical protein [Actinomadura flavalba]
MWAPCPGQPPGDLCRAGLVTDEGHGRFRRAAHARGKATRGEHDAALRRLVERYLRAAIAADHALMEQALALLPARHHPVERAGALELLAVAAERDGDRAAARALVDDALDRARLTTERDQAR